MIYTTFGVAVSDLKFFTIEDLATMSGFSEHNIRLKASKMDDSHTLFGLRGRKIGTAWLFFRPEDFEKLQRASNADILAEIARLRGLE